MAEYVYRDFDGNETSRFRSMKAKHPDIVVENGVKFHRVYANCVVNGDPVSGQYPVRSRSLPRNMPGWEKRGGFDTNGMPIVRNKTDADYAAKTLDLYKE